MRIEHFFEKYIYEIPRRLWITFFSTIILGLLIHMPMFTKKLPNWDDMHHTFHFDYGVFSGRWFVPIISKLDGAYSMPWVIGVFSLIIIAISACLVVKIMDIKQPIFCLLVAGVMVSFPTVTATFTYMFTAMPYLMSLLLAILSVNFSDNGKIGWVISTLLITFSLGLYQSYIGVTAALFVYRVFMMCFDNEANYKQIITRGLKYLGILLFGLLLYMLIVKLSTWQTGLSAYKGIDSMGKISLDRMPELISNAYLYYFDFFIKDELNLFASWLSILFLSFPIVSFFLVQVLAFKMHINKVNHIFAGLLLFLILPLAGNIIFLMVPDSEPHILMLYGLVIILITPLSLYEKTVSHDDQKSKVLSKAMILSGWIITFVLLMTSYQNLLSANKVYFKMSLAYEQTFAYSNRLIFAVENMEGYQKDMPIVFIGSPNTNQIDPIGHKEDVRLVGVPNFKTNIGSYAYYAFLNEYIGYTGTVYMSKSTVARNFAEQPEVMRMPTYPESGGIIIEDAHVIIKFSNE